MLKPCLTPLEPCDPGTCPQCTNWPQTSISPVLILVMSKVIIVLLVAITFMELSYFDIENAIEIEK